MNGRTSIVRVGITLSAIVLFQASACTRDASESNQGASTTSALPTTNSSGVGSVETESPESEAESPKTDKSSQEPSAEKSSTPKEESKEQGESPKGDPSPEPEESPSEESPTPEDSPSDPETPKESKECKDGQERPCSELPDGTSIKFPTGEPKGSCKRGVSTCIGGEWGSCEGAVGPKSKDTCEAGNDDNCNGKPTDHCKCNEGETAPCGKSEGACEQGTMTCGSGGQWGDCVGEIGPSPERCDGKGVDEDCNGMADLSDPKCQCIQGQKQACTTSGLGDCSLGAQSCNNGRWTACQPRFRRTREKCGRQSDGQESKLGRATGDEDCDGRVDETDSSSPEPFGCRWAFEDKDRDGYGATGLNVAQAPDSGTFGCLCSGASLPRYWSWGPFVKANEDCGDCLDGGAEVVPNSRRHSTSPSRCLQSLGYPQVYDYNCDDTEAPFFVGEFKCTPNPGSETCSSSGYWLNNPGPACGEEQPRWTKEDCVYMPSEDGKPASCTPAWIIPQDTRTQSCG